MDQSTCQHQLCNRSVRGRGLCKKHYRYALDHGLIPRLRRPTSPPELVIRQRTDVDANGCWLWQGGLTGGGYGVFKVGRHNYLVHRLAYETLVGPIPVGLDLDHLCRVRACCNPSHLEPVTRRENLRRGPTVVSTIRAAQTHCKRGHPFGAENTYVDRRGRRSCRKCRALTRKS